MKKIQRLVHRILLAAGLGLVASLAVGASTARGDILFSDSFQYPAGSLDFDGPPDGSPPGQTDWRTQAGYCEVGRIGLKHPGIGCKGRCVIINGNFNANAVAGIAPTNSGVAWVGFLQSLSHGSSKRGFATLNLNTASNRGPSFGVLYDSGVYGIDNETGRKKGRAYTDVAPSTDPAWLVIELDFNLGMEFLYINPSLDGGAPSRVEAKARLKMDPTFQSVGFDQIFLGDGESTGVYRYDEVRVGTTFQDIRAGD
jgi:hypothetical protein